ncbi:hypothetical protein LAV84_24960 [Rhizobium sp. VS19-DR104.2]|uniref:hypothetical protein n=1 Tax=unclassified Rhizobium TaxID=2613769 RepID=UPI00115EF7C6|nr:MULTISPECIES: hypothetical protein [unclassified Rhizobium]TQY09199.1 hypothetical protein EQW74_22480 [Rhizobium sp. rho-1.1]MBZ5762676.1 hypothetical protein [Rhizobium sp. VS19-DR96]MBZ5768640.1 hypothetical protein [Rhizobium sp. VS19-DR129.2]MBZ5776154.1 hypothetical protein [Rhizobium sp. VS19-DRK62.2]MBZ5787406.1 hypothetical protein [Rhizobium sp. VS19-DR121]
MTTVLLCSCAFLLLPNFAHVSTTSAEDLGAGWVNSVVPAAQSATVVMPDAVSNTVTPAPATKPIVQPVILPDAKPQQSQAVIVNVEPGQNPFTPASGAASPAAAPVVRTPVPQQFPVGSPSVAGTPKDVTVSGPQPGSSEIKVDDTALRYYAKTRDLKRLGAELRRLKGLYPTWEASEDLFSAQTTTVNEQPLWDMYGAGNFTGMRAEIARLAGSNPEWKPSNDLMTKLAIGETRKLIDRIYQQGNWAQVVATAQQQPQLLACSEMNTMWQVGEALAKTGDMARSFDLYKYILTECDGAPERLATMQKASALLPPAGANSLMAFARIGPDGTSEFANFTFDNLRKEMGLFASGDHLAQSPTESELQAFGAYVQSAKSAADAGLFGWYYYSQQQWQAANAWFVAGTRYGPDMKNVEGVILTLRNLDKVQDALALASRFADKSDDIRKEYIEIVAGELTDKDSKLQLNEKDIATFKDHVFAAKSALGAQALGWKLLKDKGTKEAQPLFAQSVEWEPTEGGVIGEAVLASRSKDFTKVAALKREYADRFPGLNDFKTFVPKKPKRVVRTVSAKPTPQKRVVGSKNWPF